MKLLDLITSPWALLPEQLREIQHIYAVHLRGDKIDIPAIEARLGRPMANEQQAYQVQAGGVAVLRLEGVMAPKANLFMQISGGVSTQMATLQVESAMADPRVRSLVLAIDSPGGSVFGTPELAAAILELSAIKPIVTVTDATLASAAYWVGSAANAIYITGPTVQVGSIGVVASHNYDPRAGATTTEITAGKYKRIASSTAPLSEDGRAYIQGQVDHLYSVFVDAVATHRGTTADAVLAHMADGRIHIGQQAIDAGLVDGFATLDAIVSQLAADPGDFSTRRKARISAASATSAQSAGVQPATAPAPVPVLPSAHVNPQKDIIMPITREQLAADAPEVLAAIQTEATAAGATQERERIAAVRAQALPGHEALIEALAFDGKTTGAEAAMAILAAEKQQRSAQAAALAADAPAPVQLAPAATVAATNPEAAAADAAIAWLASRRKAA